MRRVTRSAQTVLANSATGVGLNENDFQALIRVVVADGLTGAQLGRIDGDDLELDHRARRSPRAREGGRLAHAQRRPIGGWSYCARRHVAKRLGGSQALGPRRMLSAAMGGVLDSLGDDQLAAVACSLP